MAEVPFKRQDPKDKEPMEIVDNISQQHHLHSHQTRLFPQQSTNISPQVLSFQEGRITRAHVQLVQNLIERCIQLYMDQSQVVTILYEQAKIEPALTTLIWKLVEEQNTRFFEEYHMRLKLKNQIVEFNHLLEQQARMVQLMHRAPLPIQNACVGHPTARGHPPPSGHRTPAVHPAPLEHLAPSGHPAPLEHPTPSAHPPPVPEMQHFSYIPPPHSILMDGNPVIHENGGTNGPGGMLLGSFSHAYAFPMTMTTTTTSMGISMDGTQNGDLPVNVPTTGGMTRSVSLEALGQMTQDFSFPDLAACFASGSESPGQIQESFSFSELTVFASGGMSQTETPRLIQKNYSFSELAEVFASGEVNNIEGDVNMGHLGSFSDLSILAPAAVSQSPDENEPDDKSLVENIYRLQP